MIGHKISIYGIEVDKAKIEVIQKLSLPVSVRGICSFFYHAGFYIIFIMDFYKIASPLCKLLDKEVKFLFNDDCLKYFKCLKERLISTPIIVFPDSSTSFEVMCNARGVALGVVLVQRRENILHAICYARKSLNLTQKNYTVKEQKLIAVVFTFEKVWLY